MSNNYKLSFTSNSLNIEESIRIAELYSIHNDWDYVKSYILSENTLQKKKISTIIREFREIKYRISHLTEKQLQLLINSDVDSQKLMLLLAVAKTYQFIYDFIVEVIRNKFIMFDNIIYNSDYENFFRAKAAVYDKLNQLKETTINKIRSVLFTILAQSGIISSVQEKIIIQPILTSHFIKLIVEDNPDLLKIFLISDTDIKKYIKLYG